MEECTFTDTDAIEVFYRRWDAAEPRGAVVVAHGLSEHSARYGRFADALVGTGFTVLAIDHQGHGRTSESTGKGRLGPRGMEGVLDNLGHLIGIAQETVEGPVVLFGHSMGSMIAQGFVERDDAGLAGYILSGCPGLTGPEGAEMVAGIEAAVDAGMGDEPVDLLGGFNEPYEPARTPFDWLSRDTDEVDRYIADPLCGDGMPPTYDFLIEMLKLGVDGLSAAGVATTPTNLPVLLVTGEGDPASAMGAQVRGLEAALNDTGLEVTAHYYPGARHEVLNETNRDEVTTDILTWLNQFV